MRLLISLGVGLLLSALFLGIAFATDGAGGAWHHLRDVFIVSTPRISMPS